MLFSKNTKGFTLIELLVGFTLLAVLAMGTMSYVNANRGRQDREKFYNTIEAILLKMRSARTYAITNSDVGSALSGAPFGIFFQKIAGTNNLRVVSFVDDHRLNGSGVPELVSNFEYDEGLDMILSDETFSDLPGFLFQNAVFSNGLGAAPTDKLTVFFSPPDSVMRINDNTFSNDIISIELFFPYRSTALNRRICLHRVSRFLEISTRGSCAL